MEKNKDANKTWYKMKDKYILGIRRQSNLDGSYDTILILAYSNGNTHKTKTKEWVYMNHTYRRDVLITSYKYYYSNSYFISSSFFSQHRMIYYYSNPYNTGRTAVRVREHKAFFFRFLLFLCLFLFVFNLTMIILFVDQIVFLL